MPARWGRTRIDPVEAFVIGTLVGVMLAVACGWAG